MNLFPANDLLEFVKINILGELIFTKSGNRFLLVIPDRFTKLTRTIPLKCITENAVAHAFVHHWVSSTNYQRRFSPTTGAILWQDSSRVCAA